MKNQKSFVCSVLEILSFMIIITLVVLYFCNIWGILVACFLSAVTWLLLDSLQSKGKFNKIDNALAKTALFKWCTKHRKILYIVTFIILMTITVLIFI